MKILGNIMSGSLLLRGIRSLGVVLSGSRESSVVLRAMNAPWDLWQCWPYSLLGRLSVGAGTGFRRIGSNARQGAEPCLAGSTALPRIRWIAAIPETPVWNGSLVVRALDLSAGSHKGSVPWILTLSLGITLFLIPFVPTVLTVALIWAMGLLVLVVWMYGYPLRFPRSLVVPGVVFLVVLLLATITSVGLYHSMEALSLWVSYLLLAFLLSVSLDDMEKVCFVLLCVLVSASLAGGYGLYQFSRGIETQSGWLDKEAAKSIQTRAFSVFDNPNMFAAYLAFLVPAAAYFFLNAKRWTSRLVVFALGVLLAGGLAVTYTRGAWLASAIALLILGLLRDRKVLLLMLLVMVAAPLLFPATIVDRVATIGSLDDSSNLYRITIWKAALLMVKDYWASGVGLGPVPFALIYPLYEIAGTPTVHTHSLYLQIMVETGVLGLLIFLWLLRAVFKEGLTVSGNRYHSGITTALVAGLAGQMIYGLFDNIWYSPKNLFLFWSIAGIIVASRAALGGNDASEA